MADPIIGAEIKNVRNAQIGFLGQIMTKRIDFVEESIVDGDLEYSPPDGYGHMLIAAELEAGSAGQLGVVGFVSDSPDEAGTTSTLVGGAGRADWSVRGFRKIRLELRGNDKDVMLIAQASNIAP